MWLWKINLLLFQSAVALMQIPRALPWAMFSLGFQPEPSSHKVPVSAAAIGRDSSYV